MNLFNSNRDLLPCQLRWWQLETLRSPRDSSDLFAYTQAVELVAREMQGRLTIRQVTSSYLVSQTKDRKRHIMIECLGKTPITAGGRYGEARYYPWGTERYAYGMMNTTPSLRSGQAFRFTGQRKESGIGLYYYNARWYDHYL